MTDYSFKATSDTQNANWDDPSSWTGGVVPNSPDADVTFPLVTSVTTGRPYLSNVAVSNGETFTTHSIQLDDNLEVNGGLSVVTDLIQNHGTTNVSGTLTVGGTLSAANGAAIDLSGGVLSAQTITTGQDGITGSGQITAGTMNSGGLLGVAPSGQLSISATALNNTGTLGVGNVTVHATTLTNTGTLEASGGTTAVTVTSGGFHNFSAGTLSGGAYAAFGNSILALDVGGVITTDATSITINDGVITSHDPVTGQDLSLTDTLHAIAPGGNLDLLDDHISFGALNVAGSLNLTNTQLTSSQLVISTGGTLNGAGEPVNPSIVNGNIINDGVVIASGGPLTLNGDVTGSGHLEVTSNGQLELNGGNAQTIVLDASSGGPYNSPAIVQIDHPVSFAGSLAPSGHGDQIVLPNMSASSITSYSYSGTSTGGTFSLQEQGGSTLSFSINGNFTTADFHVSAGPQTLSSDPPGVLVTIGSAAPVCFVTGTMIATPTGEVAVEDLCEGGVVTGADGRTHTIVWVGHRYTACAKSPWKADVLPVLFEAGSISENVPSRPLMVSPGHSIEIESGWLIQAGHLVNGSTIRQIDVLSVTYWHVELEEHAILLANGVPAESYLDVGNRSEFANGGVKVVIHPRFIAQQMDRYCLPVIQDPVVRRYYHDKLADRAVLMQAA